MQEFFSKLFSQGGEALREMPTSRKVAIAALAIVVMGGLMGVSYFSGRPDYQVLFANLSTEDSVSITQSLVDKKVPYQLAQSGSAILVPGDQALALRLELASQGLPTGGSIGFEVFDKSSFGMTEFVQKINLKRALQGELERTINQFREIKSSRVHIAQPARKLFTKDKEPVTASVMLKMNGRASLGKEQVMAIVHLVASSVEELRSENVTVVDVEGRVLFGGEPDDAMARLSSTQMEYRANLEKDMEKRISTMLESVVGPGKVVTRVSADIDFRRVERTEKKFDPASQVARSEQRSEQRSTGAAGPSGVVGVQSNLPGDETAATSAGKPAESNSTAETVNYEINETVSHIVDPVGAVKRLSVAVLVDGKYEKQEGQDKAEYAPRSPEELGQIESLIRTAAGVETNRGDVVTVQSAPFDTTAYDEMIAETETAPSVSIQQWIAYAGIAGMALLLFLFVLRPAMGWITRTSEDLQELQTFPQTVEQLENQLGLNHVGSETVDYRAKLRELIATDPKATAEMMREWLKARR